jgi:hypothetical protein
MNRRLLLASLVVAGSIAIVPAHAVATADPGGPSGPFIQPDAWIKLCGQSLGCVIDPPPHPWRGKDVYNTDANLQTEVDDINEGEGIRYWIAFQNDGTATDTFRIQGCRGNRTYEVNAVLLGKHKGLAPAAENLTSRYKRGTLEFEIDPGRRVIITLNIITHVNKNVTYVCRTVATSLNDSSRVDVVAAEMTTF